MEVSHQHSRLSIHKLIRSDLHVRNLAFALPNMDSLSEEEFLQKLKKPETGAVRRKTGKPLEPSIPEYLVRPACFSVDLHLPLPPVKIIDFGESFLTAHPPDQLHTPLAVRAPECIFQDRLDHRVDLWSMGCMVRFCHRYSSNLSSLAESLSPLYY